MHDTINLEHAGIRSVPVATAEFVVPARAQAGFLGRPDFDAIYVRHPIQDQTASEISQRADEVIDEILARLMAA